MNLWDIYTNIFNCHKVALTFMYFGKLSEIYKVKIGDLDFNKVNKVSA